MISISLVVLLSLTGGSQAMLSDSFDIPVGDYRYVLFGLNEPQQDSARIEGALGISPDSLELEILLFHIDDFNRWTLGRTDVDTLFIARVGSGHLNVPIPGFGDMVLVISNRGNWQAAYVSASLELSYAGSGVAYNPLVDASKIFLGMLSAAVLIAVVAATVVTERKRRARRLRRAARKVDTPPPPA
jgi:hypothetical protein